MRTVSALGVCVLSPALEDAVGVMLGSGDRVARLGGRVLGEVSDQRGLPAARLPVAEDRRRAVVNLEKGKGCGGKKGGVATINKGHSSSTSTERAICGTSALSHSWRDCCFIFVAQLLLLLWSQA